MVNATAELKPVPTGLTKAQALQMAHTFNGNHKQGARWVAVYDKQRGWCAEGPSLKGGRYRVAATGGPWYKWEN
jgi:hypothetical protein